MIKPHDGHSREKSRSYRRRTFIALLALLVWLPLPLGSNRAWAWALMEAGAFGTLSFWLIGYFRHPYELPESFKAAKVPLIVLCLWLGFTLVQAVPLPIRALSVISPASYDLYSFAHSEAPMRYAPISVEQGATLVEALKMGAYITIFFLVIVLTDRHKRLRQLIWTLVFVGLGESLYGLFNTLSGIEYIWFSPKEAYRGSVTGTFINRNHFAGHLEIVIPLSLGLLLADRGSFSYYPNWKARLRGLLELTLEWRGRLYVYTVIMFAALFLSTSRAGNASLFISLVLVIVMAALIKGRSAREARYAPFIVAMAVVAGLWLGMGDLPERYTHTQDERFLAWTTTQKIIADYPIVGAGAGTFRYLFPLYEDGRLYWIYDHAHNDYLELLAEQGIVGFALLASAIILLLVKLVAAYYRRNDIFVRSVLFASLVGSISLLLHSALDFNFHIPANAAYFYVLLGIGMAASTIKRRSKE